MKHYIGAGNPMRAQFDARAPYQAKHFAWNCDANGVGTVSLNRPERKNPLTFDSYGELRDLFNGLRYATDVKVVVVTGEGGNFCSGGDVHDIIGPLTKMTMPELLEFTRMTGDLVKAMRGCPQPVIGAIDGVCAGAGAIMAMASDMRLGTARSKTAFLFNRVGLAGCDMGACAILPRIIGMGIGPDDAMPGRRDTMRGQGLCTRGAHHCHRHVLRPAEAFRHRRKRLLHCIRTDEHGQRITRWVAQGSAQIVQVRRRRDVEQWKLVSTQAMALERRYEHGRLRARARDHHHRRISGWLGGGRRAG